jgi:hypothetical protein
MYENVQLRAPQNAMKKCRKGTNFGNSRFATTQYPNIDDFLETMHTKHGTCPAEEDSTSHFPGLMDNERFVVRLQVHMLLDTIVLVE